jgi:hypothetical protein
MTPFKRIELIKDEVGTKLYETTLNRLSSKDKKDPNIVLNALSNVISQYTLDSLVEEYIKKHSMSNSELLLFIVDELFNQGVKIKGKKGAYEFLINDDMWKKHEKSWYGWLNEKSRGSIIENKYIKKRVEIKLDLPSNIWEEVEIKQKEIISDKIRLFLEREPNNKINGSGENNISLDDIEPKVSKCSKEQKLLLEDIENGYSSEIEDIIKNSNFFKPKEENQDFLMRVLPILYKKGLYKLLHDYLFPSLLTYNREKNSVKLKEANTLSNLGDDNYHEIYYILKSIKNPTKEESVDITTMLISNFKRSSLSRDNMEKKDILDTLITTINHYKGVYEKTNNYYPAINLVYMLKLLENLSPNDKVFLDYDLESIYNSVKLSIKADKKRGEDFKYYASMSDFEFKLLLGRYGDINEIREDLSNLILDLEPDKFLLERTLKQMNWFKSIIDEFGKKSRFEKLLENIDIAIEELEREISFL